MSVDYASNIPGYGVLFNNIRQTPTSTATLSPLTPWKSHLSLPWTHLWKPFDSPRRLWINWCPSPSFWLALYKFWDCD